MKIGLVIYGNLDILSGGYLYDKKLVAYLRQHGHEVTMFAQPVAGYMGRLSHNLAWRWADQIVAYQPDVLLQDELNHPSLFLLNWYLKKRLSAPIISIVHHLYTTELKSGWRKFIPQWVERQYLQTVDGFIFNSHATQQTVEQLISQSVRAVVALPGKDNHQVEIDTAFIQRRCRQTRPLQILFVGNVIPRKGVDILVNGLALLPQAQWDLAVIGDTQANSAYVQHLKSQIQALNVTESIQFLGKISSAELRQMIVMSDVLAVPSHYEGFGIVYVEALGAGLPVIAGKNGGGSEIIQHGENGYLVSPTIEEINGHVARLINQPSELKRMSLNAHTSYARFPTWGESMAEIEAFLVAQML
ncbi:glycosyltransferase family 4 protein [Anaerolineales bacterium HSG25]|nr:glycosyltransferase family 4 protein [Anaerolineales bacterium HSG25]